MKSAGPAGARAAAAANDNPVLEAGARLGYAVSGVVHLLIAGVAVQLAWSDQGSDADQSGALHVLGSTGLGSLPLWIAVAGFGLLGLWQLTEAFLQRDVGMRAKSAAKGIVYLALTWTTIAVIRGSGSSSSEQTADLTAEVMDKPFGRVLVGLAGLAVASVGCFHVVKGWRKTFLRDLREHPSRWIVRAARAGYIAKGLALVVVGALFVAAAATQRPQEARGLDGALRTVLESPLGPQALTLIALGFAAFGLYGIARARLAAI